jgi:hypothetical protein
MRMRARRTRTRRLRRGNKKKDGGGEDWKHVEDKK